MTLPRRPSQRTTLAALLTAVVSFGPAASLRAQPAPAPRPAAPADDPRSPAWWLRRAAAEAAAATDPGVRADLLDDIATYTGAAADPAGFAAAVDHFMRRLAEVQDPADRALSALNYGRLAAHLGTREQTLRVIAAGEQAAAAVEEGARREAYAGDFAALRAEAGDPAGALAGAGRLSSPTARADVYADLAATFGAKGDRPNYGQAVRLARESAAPLKDPAARSALLAHLADGQVRAGDDAGARETAGQITDPGQKGYASLALARSKSAPAPTRAKDLDAVARLALEVQDYRRGELLAGVAAARSDIGDGDGARRTLQGAEQSVASLPRDVPPACLAIARGWEQAGDKPAALAMVRRAEQATPRPPERARPEDLLAVAQAYRDLGDVSSAGRALEAAQAAVASEPRPEARVTGYEALAAADARAGDLPRWRQDVARGMNALDNALDRARPTPPKGANDRSANTAARLAWRDSMTAAAVREAAGAGKVEEVKQWIAQSADANTRASLAGEAALAAAERGQWQASRALAAGLPLAERVNVCNTAAYRAARAGNAAEAARQAALYPTPEERGNVDTGAAQALLEQQWGLPPVAEGR